MAKKIISAIPKSEMTWLGTMLHLSDLGFNRIKAEYSGYGDSGGIDEIIYLKEDETDEEYLDSDIRTDRLNLVLDGVHDFIESQVYKKLETIEDWYNDEGGFGYIIIKIPSGEFEIINNIYQRTSEAFIHEGKFTSDI